MTQFRQHAWWCVKPIAAVGLIVALVFIAQGCAWRAALDGPARQNRGATATPDEPGPLHPEPPAPAPRHTETLNPQREELHAFGYSLRVPLNWGAVADTLPGVEVMLRNIEGDSVIIIGRRSTSGIEHYGQWVRFQAVYESSVTSALAEVRILRRGSEAMHGMLMHRIDHTHLLGDQMMFSRKVAIHAGGDVLLLNFETPNRLRAEREPVFNAFLDEFRLLNPAAGTITEWPRDYVGEFRDEPRQLTMLVPRGARAASLAGTEGAGVLARYSMPPLIITLAEHLHQADLSSYGPYQVGVLRQQGHRVESSAAVTLGGRPAYRIDFTIQPATPATMFIVRASDRFYQLIFTGDELGWPYLRPLIDDIADRFTYRA